MPGYAGETIHSLWAQLAFICEMLGKAVIPARVLFDRWAIVWSNCHAFFQVQQTQWRKIMKVDSHISQLQQRHRELEARLDEVLSHPSADDVEIAEIKRQKLVLKDRISELKRSEVLH